MSKPTGGPAFPAPGLQDDEGFNGMTLRDYFAAKAMLVVAQDLTEDQKTYGVRVADELVAERAYRLADVMLAARVKP